jgi:transglutaminase-like putative cysteine protease
VTRTGRLGDMPVIVWLMLGIALVGTWTFLQTSQGGAALVAALAALVAGGRAVQARGADRGRLAITRVGQAVIAVGVVGFVMGRPDVLLTALVLLAVGAVTALRGVGNADVGATCPASATIGDRIDVDVRVHGARGAIDVVLLDPQSAPVVVDGTGAGSVVHPAEHRGVFHHIRVVLRSRGWLGVCVAVRLVVTELDRPIQVTPRPRRGGAPPPLLDASEGDDDRLGASRGRVGVVRGVRPYAPGDARRQVHWPSTARAGDLVVTEVDAPTRPAVQVVVELPPTPELPLPGDVDAWQRTIDRLTGEALHGIGDLLARGVPVRLVTIEAADLSASAPDAVVTDMVPNLRTAAIRLARSRPGPARAAAPGTDGATWVVAAEGGAWDPVPEEAPGPRHAEYVARLRDAGIGLASGVVAGGILAVALDGEVPRALALLVPLALAVGVYHLLARTWPRPVEQAMIGLGAVPLLVALVGPDVQAMVIVPITACWVALRTLADRRTAVLAGWCADAGPPPATRTLGTGAVVSAWMAWAVAPRPALVAGLVLAVVVSALAVVHGGESELGTRLDGRTPAPDRTRQMGRLAVVVAVLVALLPLGQLARDRWGPGGDGRGDGGASPASTTGVEPWVWGTDRVDGQTRPANGEAEVLWVDADRPLLLRGQAFDRFDGQAWTQSMWGPDRGPASPSEQVPPTGSRVVQAVTIRARGAAVLPAAPEAVDVRTPDGLDVLRTPDGTMFASSPLRQGDTYEVVSVLPDATPTSLRAATGPVPDDVRTRYAQPPPLSERTATLVDAVAADLPTAYDQIQALQAMLAERVTYSLDAPLPPVGIDVVDHFLFEARSGWCEQIAATLAASMRHLGVPARLVTGFAPGEWDPAAGHFVVRARDAHAWVEVFFPGIGWQGFDPTAQVPLSGAPSPELPSPSTRPVWLGLLAALVLLGLVGVAALLRRRRHDRVMAVTPPWVDDVDARLRELGTAAGVPRTTSEGVVWHGRRLAHVLGDERLADAGRVIERAAYGPTRVDDAERRAVEAVLAAATDRLDAR